MLFRSEETEGDSERDEDEDEERRNDEVSNLLLKCCEPARKV